jgi:hypothetical protein
MCKPADGVPNQSMGVGGRWGSALLEIKYQCTKKVMVLYSIVSELVDIKGSSQRSGRLGQLYAQHPCQTNWQCGEKCGELTTNMPLTHMGLDKLAEAVSLGLYVFTCLFSSKLSYFFYINQ